MSISADKVMFDKKKVSITLDVPIDSYRITADDYIYFSSDLNKYIGTEVEHQMTAINIDLAQHKKSRKIIRIAEYKHSNEGMKSQQRDLLVELAKAFDFLNKNGYPVKFQCHLIRGNYPYSKIEVTDFITNQTYNIEGDAVKEYLMVNPLKK